MLTCVPESWANWNFDITGTSADPAGITLEYSGANGTILLGGARFPVQTQGLLGLTSVLKVRGEIAATAQKSYGVCPTGLRPSFEIEAGNLLITMQTQRLSNLWYDIVIASNKVGSIARKGRWFPKWPAFVECTPEVPELVQLFCFWAAAHSWRKKGYGY